MKTKLIKRVPNLVAILVFLALLAGNAFAVENASRVVSPYWQSDSGSYTFIAVTHTSLSGMASQIGLKINAIQNDTTAFGTAVSFTIQEGTTKRIFITRTGHSTINPTSIPTASFIQGTTAFKHGHIRIDPIATDTTHAVCGHKGTVNGRNFDNGQCARCTGDDCNGDATGRTHLHGGGFRDSTMLSYWGAVVIEQNTTGFAMEFIGDMNDSTGASGVVNASANHPKNAFDVGVSHPGPAAP
jgi:hypothetical protein